MSNEEIKKCLEELVEYSELWLNNLKEYKTEYTKKIKEERTCDNIIVLENVFELINNHSKKWLKVFEETNNVMKINHQEVGMILREYSNISECTFNLELHNSSMIDYNLKELDKVMMTEVRKGAEITY